MPKISELAQGTDVDTPTKEAAVLVPVVQNGATRYLTLAQALQARLPTGTPLDGMAGMPTEGEGFPYRDALGNWSVEPTAGIEGPTGAPGATGPAGPAGPEARPLVYVLATDTGAPAITGASNVVLCMSPAANLLGVTLPPITSGISGVSVTVKRMTGGVQPININPFAPDTIDGAAILVLSAQWECVTLIACYSTGGSFWSVV